MLSSSKLFKKDGLIAKALSGYELRPQQLTMAEAVEQAIAGEEDLIVEAGAGIGKSLAYLVPFIHWAVQENKKVVVSTFTKALQNQLFVKDLPFLRRELEVDFNFVICMGSENYVCLRKADINPDADLFDSKRKKSQIKKVNQWLSETETGLKTDMDFVPDNSVWGIFSRDSDLCFGKRCPHASECFHRSARQGQSNAHILVTNHSLLFADMLSEAHVLPEFQGLVLDEAHTVEDVATRHFGKKINNTGLRYMLDRIADVVELKGVHMAPSGEIDEGMRAVKKHLKGLYEESSVFFGEAAQVLGEKEEVAPLERGQFSWEEFTRSVTGLSFALKELTGVLDSAAGKEEKWIETCETVRAYSQRCERYLESLDFIFDDEKKEYVYWTEVRLGRAEIIYSFHAAPIDISRQLKESLFDRISPIVLTSATLSSSGSEDEKNFHFIKKRMGLTGFRELALDSPYDYASNVMLYLPKGIADPNAELATYKKQVLENIMGIYDIMGGRIFALFTSYGMLNAVARQFAEMRGDVNILKQGDMPRYVLLDVFKKNQNSVLMGTTTFWQGVDVPGSALECVIITKLPFAVPSDPINAARIKSIREQGQNPFLEYQLPQAIIMFKQGFGRLIRSHADRGVVAILDPRVRTRFYGKEFIGVLPECRKTEDIRDVLGFFESAE